MIFISSYHLFQLIPVNMHSMKSVSLRCGEVKRLANASNIFINGTIFRIANPTQLKEDIMKTDVNQLCRYSHQNILDNKVEKSVQRLNSNFQNCAGKRSKMGSRGNLF